MKAPTQREALEAAIRAAELALFVIRKQGVMPNGSWARGFENDLAAAKAGLTDRQGVGGIDAVADAIDPERSPDGGWRDQILSEIHCDVENRGRVNPDFAVTVHHRNIVISAVSRALAALSQGSQS